MTKLSKLWMIQIVSNQDLRIEFPEKTIQKEKEQEIY